jgi:hypothetical protein
MCKVYHDDHVWTETEYQEGMLETGFADISMRYEAFDKVRDVEGFVRLAVLPDSFEPHLPCLGMVRAKGVIDDDS